MDLAQSPEAISLAEGDARRDRFKVSIMGQEDSVRILRCFRYNWVRSVGGKYIPQATDDVASRLKELACGFRDVIIRKEPQFWGRAQAASLMCRRTVDTSNVARVGYSLTIASSECPARIKLSIAVTGIRVPAMTRAL